MEQQDKKNKVTLDEFLEMIKTDEYENDWYSKIMTKLAVYCTYVLAKTSLSANMATFIMLLIGLASGVAFCFNNMLLGVILMQVWYLFDWIDGAIARVKNQCSKTGWYYDHLIHLINHPVFFVSIAVGLYRQTNLTYILIFGVLAAYAHIVDVSASDTYMMVLFKNLLDNKVEFKKKPHKNAKNFIALRLHFPAIINVFTLSVVLDYIIIALGFENYFNITKYVIMAYGTILPLYIAARFTKHITQGAIDKEYDSFTK